MLGDYMDHTGRLVNDPGAYSGRHSAKMVAAKKKLTFAVGRATGFRS